MMESFCCSLTFDIILWTWRRSQGHYPGEDYTQPKDVFQSVQRILTAVAILLSQDTKEKQVKNHWSWIIVHKWIKSLKVSHSEYPAVPTSFTQLSLLAAGFNVKDFACGLNENEPLCLGWKKFEQLTWGPKTSVSSCNVQSKKLKH